MRFPMFGFALLAFLLLAVVVAVAVFFAFKSGEQGKTKLSGLAGCAIALALLMIAGIGAIGTIIVGVVSIPGEAVRHGPVKSFEWRWDHDSSAPDPDEPHSTSKHSPLHVRVELRGTADTQSVMRWIRKRTDADTAISVHDERDANGEEFTVIEISPRLDAHDRREVEELFDELESELPELRLPSGGRVEIKRPDDK
jgi:hypothetical protein